MELDFTALIAGPLVMGYGLLLMRNDRFVRWGYSFGPPKLLAALIGMERAVKIARYLFGPLVMASGLLLFVGAFLPRAVV